MDKRIDFTWLIHINNKPNYRIRVIYEPMGNILIFNGEYNLKVGLSSNWKTFVSSKYIGDITPDEFKNTLYQTYIDAMEGVKNYQNIDNILKEVREIEIND